VRKFKIKLFFIIFQFNESNFIHVTKKRFFRQFFVTFRLDLRLKRVRLQFGVENFEKFLANIRLKRIGAVF